MVVLDLCLSKGQLNENAEVSCLPPCAGTPAGSAVHRPNKTVAINENGQKNESVNVNEKHLPMEKRKTELADRR